MGDDDGDGMFDGLQVHDEPTSGTTDLIGSDMLLDMNTGTERPSAANTGNSDDLMNLMGDMDMNNGSGPNGNAPPTKGTEKKPYHDIFEDLGSGGTQPPPNTTTNADSKGDGDLSSFFWRRRRDEWKCQSVGRWHAVCLWI